MFNVSVNDKKNIYRSKPVMNVDTTGSSGGGGIGVQSDWNQNDDTKPDYVKNRPFYTGDPVETVFVEESTASFTNAGGMYMAQIQSNFEATVGETYKVTWDGAVYECTCVDFNGIPSLGNLSIVDDGSDTGEPFIISAPSSGKIAIATLDTSTSHTFSISGIVLEVVEIDEKYLPMIPADKLPTGDDSPYELKEVGTKKVYVAEFHVESSDTPEKLYNRVNAAYSNGYYVLLYYYAYNSGNNPRIYNLSYSKQGTYYFSCIEMYDINNTARIETIKLYTSNNQYKMDPSHYNPYYPENKASAPVSFYLKSSGSQKLFKITVDDSGTLSATEVT